MVYYNLVIAIKSQYSKIAKQQAATLLNIKYLMGTTMKTRTLILIVLIIVVLIIFRSCATEKKAYVTKDSEELYGTWVNPEYNEPLNRSGKSIFYSTKRYA